MTKKKAIKPAQKRDRPRGRLNTSKRGATRPIILLLTEDEIATLDKLAAQNFRSRAGQVRYMIASYATIARIRSADKE